MKGLTPTTTTRCTRAPRGRRVMETTGVAVTIGDGPPVAYGCEALEPSSNGTRECWMTITVQPRSAVNHDPSMVVDT